MTLLNFKTQAEDEIIGAGKTTFAERVKLFQQLGANKKQEFRKQAVFNAGKVRCQNQFGIGFPRDFESFLFYFYSKEKNRKDQINKFQLNFLDIDDLVERESERRF